MILYEYIDRRGGVISGWALEAAQQARLDRRIQDLLDAEDRDFAQGSLIHGTKVRSIYKLKVGGNVQLRPLLCYGPVDPQTEITFLAQATERDGRLHPSGAENMAFQRLEEVRSQPTRRRRVP